MAEDRAYRTIFEMAVFDRGRQRPPDRRPPDRGRGATSSWQSDEGNVVHSVQYEASVALAQKTLQRIGNNTGLVLTTDLLKDADLEPDDEVLVHAEAGRIVITRLGPRFDDLVAAADRFVAAPPERDPQANWPRSRCPDLDTRAAADHPRAV